MISFFSLGFIVTLALDITSLYLQKGEEFSQK